jgi:hypothetical protein
MDHFASALPRYSCSVMLCMTVKAKSNRVMYDTVCVCVQETNPSILFCGLKINHRKPRVLSIYT